MFSPFYGRAVANYLRRSVTGSGSQYVVEIGGGSGRLAADVLGWLQESDPGLLDSVRYTIVEIAPNLVGRQRETLDPWIKSGHANVVNEDILKWLSAERDDTGHPCTVGDDMTHIIACEVLDNLPHDLVRVSGNEVSQAFVQDASPMNSTARTLQWSDKVDPTTNAAMASFGVLSSADRSTRSPLQWIERALMQNSLEYWVPTTCYELLRALLSRYARMSLLVADFDHLPGANPGQNGPVVQSVVRGVTSQYESVQAAPQGECDIMFPTDFDALHQCFKTLAAPRRTAEGTVLQSRFVSDMLSDEELAATTLDDGWNPVVSDFRNARVFTGTTTPL